MNRLSPPAVLKVERLERSFGDVLAVDGVSFHVAPGEIVGLLGPNGAGKTTTINMILGVLEPSGGRIEIEGVDLAVDRSRALSCTNFAAVYAPLPGNLTVEQNLRVFGRLYAVEDLPARIEKLLQRLRSHALPADQGGRSFVGRADAPFSRQGDAQSAAAASPR